MREVGGPRRLYPTEEEAPNRNLPLSLLSSAAEQLERKLTEKLILAWIAARRGSRFALWQLVVRLLFRRCTLQTAPEATCVRAGRPAAQPGSQVESTCETSRAPATQRAHRPALFSVDDSCRRVRGWHHRLTAPTAGETPRLFSPHLTHHAGRTQTGGTALLPSPSAAASPCVQVSLVSMGARDDPLPTPAQQDALVSCTAVVMQTLSELGAQRHTRCGAAIQPCPPVQERRVTDLSALSLQASALARSGPRPFPTLTSKRGSRTS